MLYPHYTLVPVDGWRWPNFLPDEFRLACPCCGEFYLDEQSMGCIQAARRLLGKPIRLNSGHRCPIHNAHVGGAPLSQHKKLAFDIPLMGIDRGDLVRVCLEAGFRSFGGYQTFLHVDTRPNRRWFGSEKARRLWTGVL